MNKEYVHPDGAAGGFQTTHWSVVIRAGSGASDEAAAALETLCRDYWYPLYAFARRQGHGPEDGQDLTQQFFAVFLEKNYFGQANPNRGRFRSFLLTSFKHFLANRYHESHTVKKGGRCKIISWDAAEAEANYGQIADSGLSPDQLFDQTWATTLLQKVMLVMQDECVRAGRGELFEAVKVFLTGGRADSTYREIGEGMNLSESAVKMAVLRLRQRYGELLRREIAHTLVDATGLDDELRHLILAVG